MDVPLYPLLSVFTKNFLGKRGTTFYSFKVTKKYHVDQLNIKDCYLMILDTLAKSNFTKQIFDL